MATPLDSASNLPADSAEEPKYQGLKVELNRLKVRAHLAVCNWHGV